MNKHIWLLAIVWLAVGGLAWAEPDYQGLVDDIKGRLDRTEQLYAVKDPAAAREMVQSAYFEVFENLEGPIRINISAKKSAEMEAAFGEIRKLIGAGAANDQVKGKINWLKGQLDTVLPVLETGHQLKAERQHDVYTNDQIVAEWRQCLQQLAADLADAVSAYQDGDFTAARQKVQRAWFDHFKNSEMEISVRLHRSREQASDINQRFSRLVKMAGGQASGGLTAFGYEITRLQEDLAELLPNLPAARATAADAPPAADHVPEADWSAVARNINAAIDAAIARYEQGDAKGASAAVQDSYFDLFEATGMENKVGSRDVAFKTRLEGYFTRLVALMKAGQPAEKLREQARGLAADLQTAVGQLGGSSGGVAEMFFYSLMIILREGLEALLIVAAIVAYLVKNGHRDKLGLIRNSVVWALIASVVTALLFRWLFANAAASREVLEGVTMLIAVVVLFGMSYWLLSKVGAQRWQAYVAGKISLSLTKGSLFGLWLTSFLAVYREGAETVLFYFALAGDAGGGADYTSLAAGFGVGCAALTVVYFIMRYTVVKLPLKPFFLVTGGFLYFMAFAFAGKGVLELVEGKVVHPTLIPHVPEIGWLGIYPYWESLAPQLILFLAAVFALWHMRRSPVASKPNPIIENPTT
ncbi:MAG: FTR1 family iron permease [Verrucomicrobiales bacterium]|nr:FTR1 family iron permease [Verrucomicrobiales bacterium]